jgi:hypothetical protein
MPEFRHLSRFRREASSFHFILADGRFSITLALVRAGRNTCTWPWSLPEQVSMKQTEYQCEASERCVTKRLGERTGCSWAAGKPGRGPLYCSRSWPVPSVTASSRGPTCVSCYCACMTTRGDTNERLAAAQRHLQRAISLNANSITVRRNLVKLAIRQSTMNPEVLPKAAVEHAEFLLNAEPNDAGFLDDAAHIYGLLTKAQPEYGNKCVDVIRRAFQNGAGPTETVLKLDPAFQPLATRSDFAELCGAASRVQRVRRRAPELAFIDPVLPTGDPERRKL